MKVRCTALNSDEGPHFEVLSNAGCEVLRGTPGRDYWRKDQLIEELEGCCATIAGIEPYTAEVLDALPELRVISRLGVGYDAIDLKACDDRGVVVAITPGVNYLAVAEHTIAMLMAVARGFPDRDQVVRSGTWERFSTPRVTGSTLGLVGFGRVGKAVAQRAQGLGMQVIAFDPFFDEQSGQELGVESVSIEELFSRSDHVSLHLPATPETHHLINRQTLARMKAGAVLINTARGSLVDENALAESLDRGHLRGAALDVFETEPLPLESPLLQQKRVLLSGHVAGFDAQSQYDSLKMTAETIVSLYRGDWPADVILNMKQTNNWSW